MEATLTQRHRLEAAKVTSRGPALELLPFHSDFIGTAPPVAQLQPFTVNVGGTREAPRLSFGVMAVSAAAAWDQHADLAEVGERVEALPLRAETLTVDAKRHQLEEAQLREVRDRKAITDAYAVLVKDNGEPTETEPRRFGFATPEFDATEKLSEATLRTQLAASLLVNAGLAKLSRDQWGEVLDLLVEPEELQ